MTETFDSTIVDLRFNEIRISTGGNNGDLFQFDAVEIAKVDSSGSLGMNCILRAARAGSSVGGGLWSEFPLEGSTDPPMAKCTPLVGF